MSTHFTSRDQERVICHQTDLKNADIFFAKFSSDIGTVRNMGRRGSCYAPEAILAVVKKLASHNLLKWAEEELSQPQLEQSDFSLAQKQSAVKLGELLQQASRAQRIIYLGGGHDHIYSCVMNLNQYSQKVVIINIDAHLDTRTDQEANSGTPFRQLDKDFQGELEIIQLGIHEYANAISTMSNLDNALEVVATYEDVRFGTNEFTENEKFLNRVIPYQENTTYFFSLDADALESSIMEGVSAVNHRGLPYNFVEDVLLYSILHLKCQHFGLFEYNPLYDNLSQKGARTLASLIYHVMDEREF